VVNLNDERLLDAIGVKQNKKNEELKPERAQQA
jgi:hypothetical protein